MKIIVNGKLTEAPGDLPDITVMLSGRLIRKAEIHDEECLPDCAYGDPTEIIRALKDAHVRVDFFTFGQKLPVTTPQYSLPFEWDNVAAISTENFDDWWMGLPQAARKNYRRAGRRGVIVREIEPSDEIIRGLMDIYNESPMRQGRPFAHYGKDFETVKDEVCTYASRCTFLGAFFEGELIGFMKFVHVGSLGVVLHIVSKNQHYDKRPANVLVTGAAEHCRDSGIAYLIYGKYTYGNKLNNPLTEFKRRTGFQKILLPRYYVPLSLRGSIFLRLKLHRGLIGILSPRTVEFLLKVRAGFIARVWSPSRAGSGGRRLSVRSRRTEPDGEGSQSA